MQKNFVRLKNRVEILSNHHQKFIQIIEKHGQDLVDRLEAAGRSEEVHLWKNAYDLSREMDIVMDVARDEKERVRFLACYHAFQILHLNLRSLDVLRLNLSRTDERIPIYRKFLLDFGQQFRKLTTLLMEKFMNQLYGENDHRTAFVITSVGSLAHQDDIDVGIIDDGTKERDELNHIIGQLRQYMFKWATEMHLYISEHVGEQTYTASIDEYRQLLDNEIGDFVIISEMLMAVPILGKKEIFHQFQRKITRRYYYSHNRDNKFHEGYLRGILGEIRSLLIRQIDENILNPKDDALRMMLGMVLAGRTIFRIYRGNRWDVLSLLCERDSMREKLYCQIEDAISFLEVFRHFCQLYIAQEEEIRLDDPSTLEQLELVAKTLGYQDMGAIKAWDHLLIHYHEKVERAKKAAAQLLESVTDHLKMISRFQPMLKAASPDDQHRGYAGNIAISFLQRSAFFKGTRFWDDILETLNDPESHLLENFVDDLAGMKPKYRDAIIDRYARMTENVFHPLMNLLVILDKNKRRLECEDIVKRFKAAFLKHAALNINHTLHFTKIFRQFPPLFNDFLQILNEDEQQFFASLIQDKLWSEEEAVYAEKMNHFCNLYFDNSHYFERFLVRVVGNYPEYILVLEDTARLQEIANGFLGNIDLVPSFDEKKRELGNYYDLQFLRVGLDLINGEPIEKINDEFTEFSDLYLQALFDICRQNVIDETGEVIPSRDLFAVYASGGHAREQAFDDDYDMIILLNEKDEKIIDFTKKIVTRMNTEIMRRGTMPHFRFSDHFGSFITRFEDLKDYLSNDHEDLFIDKSQLLGSRMIVGSTTFEKDFEDQIIAPYIFDESEQYIEEMIREMESRHKKISKIEHGMSQVKETIGGLRDIEMVLLIYKAKYRLREPLNRKLMETLCRINPDNEKRFCELSKAFNFLKHIRDLYRLTVSADDYLNYDYLDRVAGILNYKKKSGESGKQQLHEAYIECTQKAAKIIAELIDNIM